MKKLLLTSFLLGNTILLPIVRHIPDRHIHPITKANYYKENPQSAGEAFFLDIKKLKADHPQSLDSYITELEKKHGLAKDVYLLVTTTIAHIKPSDYAHLHTDTYTPANSTSPGAISLISAVLASNLLTHHKIALIKTLKKHGVIMTSQDIANISAIGNPTFFAEEAFFQGIKKIDFSYLEGHLNYYINTLEMKYGPAKNVYLLVKADGTIIKAEDYASVFINSYNNANSTLPETISLISAVTQARLLTQDKIAVINKLIKERGVTMTSKDISNIRMLGESVLESLIH